MIFSGFALGSLMGGILYKNLGGVLTLRILSVLAALSALMYFVLHILYLKHVTPGERLDAWKHQLMKCVFLTS